MASEDNDPLLFLFYWENTMMKWIEFVFLIIVCLNLNNRQVNSLDNGLLLTPPMVKELSSLFNLYIFQRDG